KEAGRLSGCEDPRITKMGDHLYMFYTAYNGIDHPRVAMSSIAVNDFINHRFSWSDPVAISEFGVHNKNSCLLPEKVNGQYVILHRTGGRDIAIDYVDSLEELKKETNWLKKEQAIYPRPDGWDSKKIGIAGPPIKIDSGWLLLYHGVSNIDHQYRVGMMILDHNNLGQVLYRGKYPIIKPTEKYEQIGDVPNVVFPCGAILVKNTLFIYYGGGDKVIGMATAQMDKLLAQIVI
ncbi:MAG: Glycosidase-related protein, partial [Microgenomates bacterium 39_6]